MPTRQPSGTPFHGGDATISDPPRIKVMIHRSGEKEHGNFDVANPVGCSDRSHTTAMSSRA
jgi:hypothetical protein